MDNFTSFSFFGQLHTDIKELNSPYQSPLCSFFQSSVMFRTHCPSIISTLLFPLCFLSSTLNSISVFFFVNSCVLIYGRPSYILFYEGPQYITIRIVPFALFTLSWQLIANIFLHYDTSKLTKYCISLFLTFQVTAPDDTNVQNLTQCKSVR